MIPAAALSYLFGIFGALALSLGWRLEQQQRSAYSVSVLCCYLASSACGFGAGLCVFWPTVRWFI